ncbi:MAG: response regulator transcription factor [Actinomycetota bacterium]|nr:response regulator transcription factor [Actinomycetota bacterium]
MEKKRILIVDDERSFTSVLSVLLEKSGFEVVVADNGLRAVEEFEIFQPHAVVLDIYMPLMDGIKVCKFIRVEKQNLSVPIIAVTAYHDEEKQQEVIEAGASLYLKKPIEATELLGHIRNVLEGSSDVEGKESEVKELEGTAPEAGGGTTVEVPPGAEDEN